MASRKAVCHPTEKHSAKGLCKKCYDKVYRTANLEKRCKYYKDWRKRHPGYKHPTRSSYKGRREHQLHTLYNITLQIYNEMLEGQGGVCAICLGPPNRNKKIFDVDHCHKTGKIRGLLCNRCNSSMGFLKDDPILVERMLNYLNGRK